MAAMDRQEFLDLAPAYALGALEAADRARFLQALADADHEMKAAYAQAMGMVANLSLAAPHAELSPSVEHRLMARIRNAPQAGAAPAPGARPVPEAAKRDEPGRLDRLINDYRFRFRLAAGVAFAAAALSVGLISYSSSLRGTLGVQHAVLSANSKRIQALEDTLAQKEALLDVIRSNQMQVAVMSGQAADPSGYGKIIWDPVRKMAILHVNSLPPAPAGKDYQLWVIRDKTPIDAGVFQVKGNRKDGELYRIDNLAEGDRSRINAFAVTLEPKGGLPKPSGAMYLLGSI
jgi:anti-sigma-K factor RskA